MTPVVDGVAGSATYQYAASFKTICGETPIGAVATITNGAAPLSSGNRVKLQISSYPAGARTVRFFKSTDAGWRLLGEIAPAVGYLFDIGQALGSDSPSLTNTSGRPNFQGLGYHPNEWRQRQEGIDDQGIQLMADQGMWDTIYKDGDIVEGLSETQIGTTTAWNFAEGKIYLGGRKLPVPAGQVTLVGTGEEAVGVVPAISWVTPQQDGVLTASADEGDLPSDQSTKGADRMVVDFTWGVDVPGQIEIKRFVDNSPKVATPPIERTILDQKIAQGIYDVSGHFVLDRFTYSVEDNPTDPTKLNLKVTDGTAYPSGYKVQLTGFRSLPFAKARETKFENNSGLDPFNIPGGYVITANTESFAVDGKAIKLIVEGGNAHTVTFSGTCTGSAAQDAD